MVHGHSSVQPLISGTLLIKSTRELCCKHSRMHPQPFHWMMRWQSLSKTKKAGWHRVSFAMRTSCLETSDSDSDLRLKTKTELKRLCWSKGKSGSRKLNSRSWSSFLNSNFLNCELTLTLTLTHWIQYQYNCYFCFLTQYLSLTLTLTFLNSGPDTNSNRTVMLLVAAIFKLSAFLRDKKKEAARKEKDNDADDQEERQR